MDKLYLYLRIQILQPDRMPGLSLNFLLADISVQCQLKQRKNQVKMLCRN